MTMNFETSFRQHLLYLLRFLRDKAATIFNYNDPKEKTFSALFMLSSDGGKSFNWIMLEDQVQWIAQGVAKDIPNSRVSIEPFVAQVLKFNFWESGLVSYFKELNCGTDVIRNFMEEDYLIKYGYRLDKKKDQSPEFTQLNRNNEKIIGALNNSIKDQIKEPIDAFAYLEGKWAFLDVPFYYFKIYPYGAYTSKDETTGKVSEKVRLLAIIPLFSQSTPSSVDKYKNIDRLYYFRGVVN